MIGRRLLETLEDSLEGDGRWMTYAEAAAALGIAEESAKRAAQRKRWRRMIGNDGRARVLVPAEALPTPEGATDGAAEGATVAPDTPPAAGDPLAGFALELGRLAEDLRQAAARERALAARVAELELALERAREAQAAPITLRQPPPPGYVLERLRDSGLYRWRRLADGARSAELPSAWSAWRAATAAWRAAREAPPARPFNAETSTPGAA